MNIAQQWKCKACGIGEDLRKPEKGDQCLGCGHKVIEVTIHPGDGRTPPFKTLALVEDPSWKPASELVQ